MHLIKNQDLINKSLSDEKSSLSSFEELMKNGYLEMASINLEIAEENHHLEEESLNITEKHLQTKKTLHNQIKNKL